MLAPKIVARPNIPTCVHCMAAKLQLTNGSGANLRETSELVRCLLMFVVDSLYVAHGINSWLQAYPTMSIKSVHSSSGNSSRRRPRTYSDSDSGPTKRFKSDSRQHAASQPLSCSTDQCVPSCYGTELEIYSDGMQVDFYSDRCSLYAADERAEVECSKLEEHPLGIFALLPPEIFHLVLSLLEISDVDAVARTSSEMCAAICGYVYTPAGLNSVLPQYSEGDFAEPMEFHQLGMTL